MFVCVVCCGVFLLFVVCCVEVVVLVVIGVAVVGNCYCCLLLSLLPRSLWFVVRFELIAVGCLMFVA